MTKQFYTLLAVTFLICASCNKKEDTSDKVLQQFVTKITNAQNTDVQLTRTYHQGANLEQSAQIDLKISKVDYDPFVGVKFLKTVDDNIHIYYEPAALFVVENNKKRATTFDFQNDNSAVTYLKAYINNDDNLFYFVKNLQFGIDQDKVTFKGKNKVNNQEVFAFNYSYTDRNIQHDYELNLNPKTSLPINLVDKETGKSNGIAQKQTIVRAYKKIDISPVFNDEIFKPKYDTTFTYTVFQSPSSQAKLLPVGSDAPDFSLSSVSGKKVSLNSLLNKPTFVECWVSTCEHCMASIPKVKALYEKYHNKINVVTVNFDYDNNLTKATVKEQNIPYPVLFADEAFNTNYMISLFPTYYIIGTDGKIIYANHGTVTETREQEIQQVLDKL
ncbi:TlpA family protein disulfide reductase [Zhouia sp. PK063]|uniref:TlpA family protein disulfide reductase n=1 Tax=Zhouia sp. PK063 TaxID=3373602 RepID=UPI003789EE4E